MRADRLVATMLILQARGRVSAGELARELEVSVKTARRDLEALAMAGVPVYAQPGRNGGWSLLGEARTDLTGLTADEARTLFLVAGPSARVAPEAKAALRKLVRALPEPFRKEAAAAGQAIVIDPTRWGRTPPPAPPALEPLQRAILDGVQVRIAYGDRSGRRSERVVSPLGLVQKGLTWYLLGGTEDGQRTFRVDRIRHVSPTAEPTVRPPGFDVDAAWDAARRETDARRRREVARVVVGAARLPGLRGQFGDDLTVVRPLDDDQRRARDPWPERRGARRRPRGLGRRPRGPRATRPSATAWPSSAPSSSAATAEASGRSRGRGGFDDGQRSVRRIRHHRRVRARAEAPGGRPRRSTDPSAPDSRSRRSTTARGNTSHSRRQSASCRPGSGTRTCSRLDRRTPRPSSSSRAAMSSTH